MKKLVSSGRLFAFGVLVVTLIALCVVTLYKLQIIEGAAYYEGEPEQPGLEPDRHRRARQHPGSLRPGPGL